KNAVLQEDFMNQTGKLDIADRREEWIPPPRPEWAEQVNELGRLMNIGSVVPLDEESLLAEARRNTGLKDFGDDGWSLHFRALLRAIENEAELNLVGRLLTRSDLLVYLEARLRVIDTYARYPEIEREEIREPVFILGF